MTAFLRASEFSSSYKIHLCILLATILFSFCCLNLNFLKYLLESYLAINTSLLLESNNFICIVYIFYLSKWSWSKSKNILTVCKYMNSKQHYIFYGYLYLSNQNYYELTLCQAPYWLSTLKMSYKWLCNGKIDE